MRCPTGSRGVVSRAHAHRRTRARIATPAFIRAGLVCASLSLAALTAAACSRGETTEAGAVGTTGAGAPLGISVAQTYVTIENRTTLPLVEGVIELMPGGVLQPFRTPLTRIEAGDKRDFVLNNFRSADGTPFRRGATRARTVRVTATDVTGNKYEQTAPFN
jgi:hypothetical protein